MTTNDRIKEIEQRMSDCNHTDGDLAWAIDQLKATREKLEEAVEALKRIADLSNGRVKRHIDDYGDIARSFLASLAKGENQ